MISQIEIPSFVLYHAVEIFCSRNLLNSVAHLLSQKTTFHDNENNECTCVERMKTKKNDAEYVN